MKRTLQKYVFGILLLAIPTIISAQTSSIESVLDSTSLRGQFDYIYSKSNTYEQYKVVKISSLNALKENSLDSIKRYKDQISENLKTINKLNKDLNTQNAEIKNLKEELASTKEAQNSIGLLGMQVTKGAYNTLMWGIIFILLAISAVLLSLYKRGHHVVKTTKNRLAEVQEDLEKLRKNALVREQKLARELMDFKLKNRSSR